MFNNWLIDDDSIGTAIVVDGYGNVERYLIGYECDYDDDGNIVEHDDADIVYAWDYDEQLSNAVSKVFWKSTDWWRWYYDVDVQEWYTVAKSDWFPTMYDESVMYKMIEQKLLEKIFDWEISIDFSMIVFVLRTSNVFSVWTDIIIKEEDKEKFLALYKEHHVEL